MESVEQDRTETLNRLQRIFEDSSCVAQKTLFQMMKREVSIKVIGLKELPFEEVPRYRYPEDVPVAMIVLRLMGDAQGFLAFVMFEESAKKVNQILWEEVPQSSEVLNISNVSALKEMGNIVGSCFLNHLANCLKIELRPSEPLFVYDLMAAMMDTLLLEQSVTSDKAILVDTQISSPLDGISFDVLFFPSGELLEKIYHGIIRND